MRFAIFFLLILAANAFAAEQVIEVIELKYRPAEEVLPLVRSFINERGGTITGARNQLIVRTSPENLEEIKRILAAVDKAPKRLLITVKNNASEEKSRSEAEIAADIGGDARVIAPGSRDRSGVTIGGRDGDDSVRVRAQQRQAATRDASGQRIEVLEGYEAFISVGRSAPFAERTVITGPHGAQVIESTQYRDFSSGFYVLPRVTGDSVNLAISQRRESFGDAQRAQTSVTAKLGEWVEIAGVSQDRSTERSRIASRERTSRASDGSVWIKVEELP
ncbi:MAG: secretin N-terminal domain-containing protein [Burkholderiales bacterium]